MAQDTFLCGEKKSNWMNQEGWEKWSRMNHREIRRARFLATGEASDCKATFWLPTDIKQEAFDSSGISAERILVSASVITQWCGMTVMMMMIMRIQLYWPCEEILLAAIWTWQNIKCHINTLKIICRKKQQHSKSTSRPKYAISLNDSMHMHTHTSDSDTHTHPPTPIHHHTYTQSSI